MPGGPYFAPTLGASLVASALFLAQGERAPAMLCVAIGGIACQMDERNRLARIHCEAAAREPGRN